MVIYSQGRRHRPKLRYEPELALLSPDLLAHFEKCECDAETEAFLQYASNFSLWRLLTANLLQALFVSRTTANGLVGRGSMFVLSTAQACQLLRPQGASPSSPLKVATEPLFGSLLDIGAGDGNVTAKIAPLFREVFATEYSATMRWRLRRRGYSVLNHEDPFHEADAVSPDEDTPGKVQERVCKQYDVISCLNVLDRADTPLSLLRSMRDSLRPETGRLILAVVLPWCPFVEYNSEQRQPSERLPMTGGECCKGASFEASASRLVENVLQPCGFEIVRWTRLPYLCEGNFTTEYALLNDAVFILKRKECFEDTALLDPLGYSSSDGCHR